MSWKVILLLWMPFLVVFACTVCADSPVVSFTGKPTAGFAPLNITFQDTSPGTIAARGWYFGDEDYSKGSWVEQNASAPWNGRYGHTCVSLQDGSIVLIGGGGAYKNDVWCSPDLGRTWTQQNAGAGFAGRSFHTSVVLPDGSIVIMGGYNGTYLSDVWRSPDQGVTWTCQNSSAAWPARAKHAAVAIEEGSILLMGGFNGAYLNDIWRSDDQGISWYCVTSHAEWSPRYGLAGVVLPDQRIAIMGGMYYQSGEKYSRDLWISNDRGLTWAQQSYPPGQFWTNRRYHSSAVLPDGSIVILGGESSGYLNDMVQLVEQGTTWLIRKYQLPEGKGRYYHSSTVSPGGTIVLAGGYVPYTIKNDVWRFDTAIPDKNPLHIYREPGSYDVTLQVSDGCGINRTRKVAYISVGPELPAPYIEGIMPDYGLNNGTIKIKNLSGLNFDTLNIPSVKLTRTGYPDIPADDVATLSSSQISCRFDLAGQPPGLWNIDVTNPDGKTCLFLNGFSIGSPPLIAGFTCTPVFGKTPLAIHFTDVSTGSPVAWDWDFGDGTKSADQNPLHTYKISGTYTVMLTVRNDGGSDTAIMEDCITVIAARPPVITSFSPARMVRGKASGVVILGNYFQKGATVQLVQGGSTIPISVTGISPPSKISGKVAVPLSARGKWSVILNNPDGGISTRPNAITIT